MFPAHCSARHGVPHAALGPMWPFFLGQYSNVLPVPRQVIFTIGKEWAGGGKVDDGSQLPIDHLFSCENSKGIQTWILKSHSPQVLVADIKDVAESLTVLDEKTQKFVRLPDPTALMAGWVCHDTMLGLA